jgi:hypothetical protein
MLLEHMTRRTLINPSAIEAAKLDRSWLPSFQTVANLGRTGCMPALAGGAQA